jgi:CheY-like chemotaxis protein
MSHELRTPLNAILGFGHLLATDASQPLAPGQQRKMDEILHGARHLLQLINELLDLAVIEAGNLPVHLQPVALAPALCDALALLQPLAASRGVALPLAASGLLPGATVRADPVRLKQVLLNLLGNAIKYNRPQGTVRLLCDPLARAGEAPGSAGWRITVQDSGPGLDDAQQARLFSAFDRLGAEAGPVEGTGLGLALSRGLVRAMGGELGVHSHPGEGSSFWLQLDTATPDDAATRAPALVAPPPRPVPPWPGAGGRGGAAADDRAVVLYIEDNPVNRMLMQAVFEQLPQAELRVAASAAQGLQMAMDQAPALVLMDIQLPDLDGLALLPRLRAHPPLARVPVIAVSADATPAAINRAQAVGFDDYLTKPLDTDRLVAAVRTALQPG